MKNNVEIGNCCCPNQAPEVTFVLKSFTYLLSVLKLKLLYKKYLLYVDACVMGATFLILRELLCTPKTFMYFAQV